MPKNQVTKKRIKPIQHSSTYYRKLKKRLIERKHEIINESNIDQVESTKTIESFPNFFDISVENNEDDDDNVSELVENERHVYVNEFIQDELNENSGGDLSVEEIQEFVQNDNTVAFAERIKDWALKNSIKHTALNGLLKILKANGFPWFPKDSRSLLKTPRKIEISPIPFIYNKNLASKTTTTGKYWYNGFEKSIRNSLSSIVNSDMELEIAINVDGLPIHNSSNIEFWPILALIIGLPVKPIIIGIASGRGKPNLKEYLSPFVDEMKKLWYNGMEINGHTVLIRVKYFVCDSPARAYIKGMKLLKSKTKIKIFVYSRISLSREALRRISNKSDFSVFSELKASYNSEPF